MNKLANQLIKMGHTNPELRPHLRPILDEMHAREAGIFDKLKRVLKRDDRDDQLTWIERIDKALKKGGLGRGVSRQKAFVGWKDPVRKGRDGLIVDLTWSCGSGTAGLEIKEDELSSGAFVEVTLDGKKKWNHWNKGSGLDGTIKEALKLVDEMLVECGGVK